MAIFSIFFLGIIGQENVFYDIPEQKNAFLGYKNKKFKKSEMAFFPKGVTLGFGVKMAIFPTLSFLFNIGHENVFYDILERKNAFLGYRNKNFKKLKNWHFFKGVNPWFWSKNGHFSNFYFFRQCNPGKCLLRYSRTKSAFLSYKNKNFYNSKNWHFSKRVTHVFGSKMAIFPIFFLGTIG